MLLKLPNLDKGIDEGKPAEIKSRKDRGIDSGETYFEWGNIPPKITVWKCSLSSSCHWI